ncbi:hypothetical protein [Halocatena halophila]|uniref:hypothetical protein n=1 Tax=Halocatena halophila TaxID=2814576 RepID=UPI002ED6A17B
MAATQAAEIRGSEKLSPVSKTVYETIRGKIPPPTEDRQLTRDFDRMEPLTSGGELIQAVEENQGADLLSLTLSVD